MCVNRQRLRETGFSLMSALFEAQITGLVTLTCSCSQAAAVVQLCMCVSALHVKDSHSGLREMEPVYPVIPSLLNFIYFFLNIFYNNRPKDGSILITL